MDCEEIGADWGAQRIKDLSISKTLLHAVKQLFSFDTGGDVAQKGTSTSLIEQFLYPKYGPGQMWEQVAERVSAKGGEVLLNHEVTAIDLTDNGADVSIKSITVKDLLTGHEQRFESIHVISTMPIKDLVNAMGEMIPSEINTLANDLIYRDFMTAGVLVKKLRPSEYTDGSTKNMLPDNWIYIQEKSVKLGRLQIFNNWSPDLVKDKTYIGSVAQLVRAHA